MSIANATARRQGFHLGHPRFPTHDRLEGFHVRRIGRGSQAIKHHAGSYEIEIAVAEFQQGGRIRSVNETGRESVCAHRIQHAAKCRQLYSGVAGIFVGRGEMRIDAFQLHSPRGPQCSRQSDRLVWQQAQPVHARVDLQMHAQLLPIIAKRREVLRCQVAVKHADAHIQSKRQLDLLGRHEAQRQDRRVNACLAQLQCLRQVRPASISAPFSSATRATCGAPCP